MARSKQTPVDPADSAPPWPTPNTQNGTEKTTRPLRLTSFSRWLHRWVGTLLALIMIVLSITGGFVAYKNRVEYLQPAARAGTAGALAEVISPARVAEIVLALNLSEAPTLEHIDRIELRPAEGMYKVRLEQISPWRSPREIQVDAVTGDILNVGVRGDQLWMDIHSLAVFGEAAKLVSMTLAGLVLLWLSLSGYYLFFYPLWVRARRRRES